MDLFKSLIISQQCRKGEINMSERKVNISEYWDESDTKAIKEKYPTAVVVNEPIVTIKRISFGRQNDILDLVSNVSVKGKNVEVTPKYGQLRTLTLNECIVSAPFPVTLEYIQKELPSVLGELLFIEIDMFNNFKKEKKVTSEVAGVV